MKLLIYFNTSCRYLLLSLLLGNFIAGSVTAAEQGIPYLPEPQQKEKFFDPDRYTFTKDPASAKQLVQPHFSISHDKREDNVGVGVMQTNEIFQGEAGGRLNLLGNISLTTFAKVPVYTKESVDGQTTADTVSSNELLKDTGRLSWRSELGVPVKKGVDLNFFYDNSTIGRVDKPGIEEREEKFGTRFIFKFK